MGRVGKISKKYYADALSPLDSSVQDLLRIPWTDMYTNENDKVERLFAQACRGAPRKGQEQVGSVNHRCSFGSFV